MDAMDIDTQRYSRQIMLENIGYEGQIKLGKSTVTVVGAGGLGSPILQPACNDGNRHGSGS